MVNYCNDDGCNTMASFNYENDFPGAYCKQHKLPEMINVNHRSKWCQYDGCRTEAIYNFEGQKKAVYCSSHKEDGMINIITKTCRQEGCTVRPVFNYPDKKSGMYCNTHKLPDMVNVGNNHRKCQEPNCSKRANFNFEGETKPIYCMAHKFTNMVNIVDIKCKFPGCKIIANYNFIENKVGILCSSHKEPGMIDVRNKQCEHLGCQTRASSNFEEEKNPRFCHAHKSAGMVQVVNICKTYKCQISANNPNYRGYCIRCFMHNFPDKPITRNYKVKERHVTDYIKEKFPDFQFLYDKRTGGCSHRRPDIFVDMLTHVVIIEINEFQHEKYDTTCEEVRLNELFEDFGFRPIVWILFNPDGYRDEHGIEIKSCFVVDKRTGILVIAPRKKTEWRLRLERLKDAVEHQMKNIPDDNIFEHLYYDALRS